MTSTSMMGSVPDVVTVFGEYCDFGGILVPISATQRALGVESLLTVEHIACTTPSATRSFARRQPSSRSSRAKG